MKTLGESPLSTFLNSDRMTNKRVTNERIRRSRGLALSSFSELVEGVAWLSFYNRDHVLLFRGQDRGYSDDDGRTIIQPSIFRLPKEKGNFSLVPTYLNRFDKLRYAGDKLLHLWEEKLPEVGGLRKHLGIRWAILQHYEICPTPLLDLTHSLRVAASFAVHAARAQNLKEAVLYVIAVPQIAGAITTSEESGIQILRLSSICPPVSHRPHFQEGYLVGNFPEFTDPLTAWGDGVFPPDFSCRLLCKFRLRLEKFWTESFPPIPKAALYPTHDDPLLNIASEVRAYLGRIKDWH